jgi:membrane protease YdiL (CAAX protease family)
MNSIAPSKNHPLAFFALVYVMSMPFWLISIHLGKSGLPDNMPLTDIGATLSPALAACILIFRENGKSGLKEFLRRVYDVSRIKRKKWLVIAACLLPAIYLITYAVMRCSDLPVTQSIEPSTALFSLFTMFLIAAIAEEIGYSAYATDALQKRLSALTTALLIGIPWALWHLPSMIEMGQPWQLIVWGLMATIAFRVITVWLYNNTNYSLFAVIIAHAIGTTARSAFPGGRSGYELGHGSISYGIIIFVAFLVIGFWGPSTLSNFRSRLFHSDQATSV